MLALVLHTLFLKNPMKISGEHQLVQILQEELPLHKRNHHVTELLLVIQYFVNEETLHLFSGLIATDCRVVLIIAGRIIWKSE